MPIEAIYEEVTNIPIQRGGTLRYEKTFLDPMGRKTVKPQLIISIDGSKPFYAQKETLERMIVFLEE